MTENQIFNNLKAAYYTLGCKLNFAETSTIGKQLTNLGIKRAQADENADICIVNTCSVTELADRKCRQAIRKLARRNPNAYIIVTGCYAQLKPEDVKNVEGVDLVLGTQEKTDIAEYIVRHFGTTQFENSAQKQSITTKSNNINEFAYSCARGDRTRYFLKVQDGCDYYCSYCTIPYARGRSRNGSIDELVSLARQAGDEGAREIVLTGVNIGDFGKSTGETFFQLLRALDKVENVGRFRISSIEPNLLTDEILEFTASSQRIAPHFHIPLQSGSDDVLKLMRRKYDTALFAARIEKIKHLMPDAFIGVDVIVGTRGETDSFFDEGQRFIESLPVSQLHVFAYSERPGTQALKIEHCVDPQEKRRRSNILLALSEQKTLDFYRSMKGTKHNVLFEHTKKADKMFGFTENYLKVATTYNKQLVNQIVPVELKNLNEEELCFSHPQNISPDKLPTKNR